MARHMSHTLLALAVSAMTLPTAVGNDGSTADIVTTNKRQHTGAALNTVETITMSEGELANQPQGQSEPGAGKLGAGETGKQTPSTDLPVSPAGWTVYVDPTHGFSIGYPKGFVIQSQQASKLAQFTPIPIASIFFMNPTMAKGDFAGIEPPDLEVRVYRAGAADSLQSWLVSVSFVAVDGGTSTQPYRNASVSGLKVCQSTMIAPGCSVYILRGGRVYQLTPISREGEAMIETFVLPPVPSD